jgi:hypothetical protein
MKSSLITAAKQKAVLFWRAPRLTKIITIVLLVVFGWATWQVGKAAIAGVKWLAASASSSNADVQNEQKATQAGNQANTALQSAAQNEGERVVNEQEYQRRAPLRQQAAREAEESGTLLIEQERRYAERRKSFKPSTGPIDIRERRAVARAKRLYEQPPVDKP